MRTLKIRGIDIIFFDIIASSPYFSEEGIGLFQMECIGEYYKTQENGEDSHRGRGS